MAGITRKSFDHPDDVIDFTHGRSLVIRVDDDEEVWKSELGPGWNWDEDAEPYAEGASSCPMTHREYVVAGRIRYLMEDGTEEIGTSGDFLFVEPGHRAWVLGDETCVLIDW